MAQNERIDFRIEEFAWEDIEKYKEDIIEMQMANTYIFHYPNRAPNRSYVSQKVFELEEHLKTGKTLFLGGTSEGILYGFIWIYEAIFIEEKRMVINSFFVREDVRGTGLGFLLMEKAKKIAVERNCTSIATHYAAFNTTAGSFYLKNGFKISRIEMVYEL